MTSVQKPRDAEHPPAARAARPRRRHLAAVGAGVALIVGAVAVLAGNGPGLPAGSDGPLVFPDGYSTITAALPERAFAAFDLCVHGPPRQVTVNGATARLSEGVGTAQVRIGWLSPKVQPEWGAGRISNLHPVYRPATKPSTGEVSACQTGAPTLELAVLFPEAVTADALVDAVILDYTVEGVRYRETSNVRLGVCASAADAEHAVPECAD